MTGNHWHPEGAGVFLETQDGRLDLTDLAWQEIAPCGCVSGVTVAATDELIVTAEQAGRHFASSSDEYDRDVERGYSWRAREHKEAVGELQSQCPHDPKWGVEPIPIPEGYVWAAVHALGSRPKRQHLVPQSAVQTAKDQKYGAGHTSALCRRTKAFWWSDEWYAKDGLIECDACVKAAKKREAVPA